MIVVNDREAQKRHLQVLPGRAVGRDFTPRCHTQQQRFAASAASLPARPTVVRTFPPFAARAQSPPRPKGPSVKRADSGHSLHPQKRSGKVWQADLRRAGFTNSVGPHQFEGAELARRRDIFNLKIGKRAICEDVAYAARVKAAFGDASSVRVDIRDARAMVRSSGEARR